MEKSYRVAIVGLAKPGLGAVVVVVPVRSVLPTVGLHLRDGCAKRFGAVCATTKLQVID